MTLKELEAIRLKDDEYGFFILKSGERHIFASLNCEASYCRCCTEFYPDEIEKIEVFKHESR